MKPSATSREATIVPRVRREPSASETAASLLKYWLQRLGYYSIFAALPVVFSEPAEAASDDTRWTPTPVGLPLQGRSDRRPMPARTRRFLAERIADVDI